MKRTIKFLATVVLGIIVGSCDLAPDHLVSYGYGIEEQEDFYTSWLNFDLDGEKVRYETTLAYPSGRDTTIRTMIDASEIVLEKFFTNNTVTKRVNDGDIIKYTIEVECCFQFTEFTIPVVFTVERAEVFIPNTPNRVMFPTVDIKPEVNEIILTDLPDLVGITLPVYSIVLSITDKYFTASTEVKIHLGNGYGGTVDISYDGPYDIVIW